MQDAAEPMVIAAGTGADGHPVRLMGHYSKHPEARGLAFFFHGWEGSEESTYVQTTARRLYDRGLSVFRMVYRDHGDTHHLNEGMFFAPHFAEVLEATRQAAKLADGLPVYVVGYSLGGNYALRLAARHEQEAVKGLAHVFAISPVIDPLDGAPLVDAFPLIKRYFLKKLRASLSKKQAAFPDLYDFDEVLEKRTVMEMTDWLMPRYSQWDDRAGYFNAYKIGRDMLSNVRTPVTIINAKDDPIIPPGHIHELELSPTVELIETETGGHNGFFDTLLGPAWYERYIWARLGLGENAEQPVIDAEPIDA
jgi:predicted alpha/beta-fold hydrolase